MEQQAKSVDQYKQEMLAQARRNSVPAPAAQAQATAKVKVVVPAHEKVTPAEHVERVLEKAEPIVEAAEPFAEIALRSGLASAGAAIAAKGLELGVEALEAHIERKREERHTEHAAPPAPPPPAAPAPVVDINFSPQIVQTAPVVVAPTVTAPAVAAQTAAAPSIVAPAVEEVTVAAPPPPPVPAFSPVTAPAKMPVPVPLPPVPPPPPVQAWPPMAPPAQKPSPIPVPVAVPARPVECETVTCTVMTAPCGRPASCSKPPLSCSKPQSKPCCPAHNSCRQSCCASRRPTSCSKPSASSSCKCAPRACTCKTSRVSPQAEGTSWFMQPAVEAAYAAYTAGLASETAGDEAVFAYRAPEAVAAAAIPDVAYAGQATISQTGYYELPVQDYVSLEDYLARNTARGILELQVRVASDDAAPVQGANVDIMRTIAGVTYLFFHGVTDANGSAGRIALPAPDRSLSFAPPHGFVPYAVYTVSVTHGDYAPQVFENVTVFPDTEAIQVVRLGMAEPYMVDEGRYVM